MRVLLSGSTGFIGKRVLPLLAKQEVFCLDRTNLPEVKDFAPEIVIHLAWPGVYGDRRHDETTQRAGYVFTQKLLHAIGNKCCRWVGVGSQAEVSKRDSPYAIFKRWSLFESNRWAVNHNVSFAWARLYSVYGPGQVDNSYLPYVISELLENGSVDLTDQNIPWDFLYVDDAAKAIVSLAMNPTAHGVYEVASSDTIHTQEAAYIVRDKIDPTAKLLFGAKKWRPVEIDGIKPVDISRMIAIGWEPLVSFSDGVDALIQSIRDAA